METKLKSLISRAADQEAKTGIQGHPALTAYQLLQKGKEGSLHLRITLDEIEPGGGIDPHYHTDFPPFDHAYYVISGDIVVSLEGQTQKVGTDSLIYCHSDVTHSITNVGKNKAKVLVIKAASDGAGQGKAVYCT